MAGNAERSTTGDAQDVSDRQIDDRMSTDSRSICTVLLPSLEAVLW